MKTISAVPAQPEFSQQFALSRIVPACSREFPEGSSRQGHAPKFLPREYLAISGRETKLHNFRVDAVDPLALTIALINTFALGLPV